MVLGGTILVAASTAAFIGVRCRGNGVDRQPASAALPPGMANYARAEAFTYLTLPEWFIVYSTDEYARFIDRHSPSDFPYAAAVGQYWGYYDAMCQATRHAYPFETGYHLMLGVIGASFTVENGIRWAYENTIGRLSAWISSRDTAEDRFAARVAAEYGAFMHAVPWYEFPFSTSLVRLWREVPLIGPHPIRKWERRIALSAEYAVKAAYGWAIQAASSGAYDPEALAVHARVDAAPRVAPPGVTVIGGAPAGAGGHVVRLPRYEAFTTAVLALLDGGARFRDIAGNDEILVTALGPAAIDERALRHGNVVTSRSLLTDPGTERLAVRVDVADLHRAIPELRNAGATIEHVYDY